SWAIAGAASSSVAVACSAVVASRARRRCWVSASVDRFAALFWVMAGSFLEARDRAPVDRVAAEREHLAGAPLRAAGAAGHEFEFRREPRGRLRAHAGAEGAQLPVQVLFLVFPS